MLAWTRTAFVVSLLGISVLALGLRISGLQWLSDATPHSGFSFHPDVMRFVKPVDDFENIKGWRGYPLGMTTHVFVAEKTLELIGLRVDRVTLIRSISLIYGILTVCLSGVLARALTGSAQIGLLTALFLALSPMHIINSHFGTADAATVFFLYVTLLFGWRYLRYQREFDFLLFTTSVGVSLAIKFFVPLLVPLAIVVWQQERRLERATLAVLVISGSFAITNFFNYSPWEMKKFLTMLLYDNVIVVGGHSPLGQLGLYSWTTVRALGFSVWLFFALGLWCAARQSWRSWARKPVLNQDSFSAALRSPHIVPISAFIAYAGALLSSQLYEPRFMLPFIPLLCFVAAYGFRELSASMRTSRVAGAAMLTLVLAYQLYNAIGVELQYHNDIRNAVAVQLEKLAQEKEDIVTFSNYSYIRGSRPASGEEAAESRIDSEFFVTCDLEYSRYLQSDDASRVFHAFGGQERLNFYRDLFQGRLSYRVAFEVAKEPLTLEERLRDRGLLTSLGEFLPHRCVIFVRTPEADPL